MNNIYDFMYDVYDFVVIEDSNGSIYNDFVIEVDYKEKEVVTQNGYLIDEDGFIKVGDKEDKKTYTLLEVWKKVDDTTYKKVFDNVGSKPSKKPSDSDELKPSDVPYNEFVELRVRYEKVCETVLRQALDITHLKYVIDQIERGK